jgi:transcriptional regulator with XRE-family HTH domain
MRRKLLSMSQADLGAALGVTFQQVQKYEKGTNRISVGRLQQIADTLRVPISFFFDDPMKPKEGGAGRQARSPDYVSDFLTTTDGLALAEAFMLIKDVRLRRSILRLVKDLVGEDD